MPGDPGARGREHRQAVAVVSQHDDGVARESRRVSSIRSSMRDTSVRRRRRRRRIDASSGDASSRTPPSGARMRAADRGASGGRGDARRAPGAAAPPRGRERGAPPAPRAPRRGSGGSPRAPPSRRSPRAPRARATRSGGRPAEDVPRARRTRGGRRLPRDAGERSVRPRKESFGELPPGREACARGWKPVGGRRRTRGLEDRRRPRPRKSYGVARRSSESLRSIFLRAWITLRFRFALGFS